MTSYRPRTILPAINLMEDQPLVLRVLAISVCSVIPTGTSDDLLYPESSGILVLPCSVCPSVPPSVRPPVTFYFFKLLLHISHVVM